MSTSSVTAKQPVAAPAAATAGIVSAIAVTAVGVVGIHDTMQTAGVIGGTSWIGWVADKAEVLLPVDWMIYAGIGAVVVGLLFLIAALKPRRGTHLAVGVHGVWIRRGDIARLATDTARATNAVTSATSKAKGRSVWVTATATSADTSGVGTDLAAAITRRLQAITPTPRVRTRVTVEEN